MLETSIAGSLPRPDWLAEPETLKGAWKLSGQALEDGKRRAAADWLRHQEEAGIHTVTNGEVFRTHFVHGFLEGLTGIEKSQFAEVAKEAEGKCPISNALRGSLQIELEAEAR